MNEMELKRKSHICEGVEAAVAEAIRRELRNHDDIARLVWWASALSRADLTGAARVNRPWMADRRLAAQLVAANLEAAAPLIDSEALTLHQRGTVTKGVAVLMFAQCTILLKDARHACKRAYSNSNSRGAPAAATLPRSKTRGRHVASAATPEHAHEPLWNRSVHRVLTDKKLRLECLDTRMKTPNAHDGFAFNKIIMGVGIYSQFEFDEQNNIRKQLTQVVKWNAPADAKSPAAGLLGTDDVMRTAPALCNAPSKLPRQMTYLHDLDDAVGEQERVQLRRVKRAALEAFDDCVVVAPELLLPKRRSHHTKTAHTAFAAHAPQCCPEPRRPSPGHTCTWFDIRETLLHECELKYKMFLVMSVEQECPQQRPVTDRGPRTRRGVTRQRSSGESKQRSYPLRSTKARVENAAHSELLTKVRECCVREQGEGRCCFREVLSGERRGRQEISLCFLELLELATQGKLGLTQRGPDIVVELSPCVP